MHDLTPIVIDVVRRCGLTRGTDRVRLLLCQLDASLMRRPFFHTYHSHSNVQLMRTRVSVKEDGSIRSRLLRIPTAATVVTVLLFPSRVSLPPLSLLQGATPRQVQPWMLRLQFGREE